MCSYANMGWGSQDNSGLLNLNIPIDLALNNPSSGLLSPANGQSGMLPGPAQSAMWTFHPRSSRLLAHYVNSDGRTVPTYFVTGGPGCQHTICLVADVEAFKGANGADALEVVSLASNIRNSR